MTGAGLSAAFRMTRGATAIDVQLEAHPGRPLALVGPNGAGKTSALGAIAGLFGIESGSILVDGTTLADAQAGVDLPAERRRLGVVFQDFLLFPHLSVRDNVAFGLRVSGVGRGIAREKATAWIERLDLLALANRLPSELSGGQSQRVALARALAVEPRALLLDEPMAALDVEVRDEVRAELRSHLRAFDGPTVIVTHSRDDVMALAEDVVVLEAGRVTQRGPFAELAAAPATSYVERLTR